MYKIRQIQNYNFKIHVAFCTVSCCINIIHFLQFYHKHFPVWQYRFKRKYSINFRVSQLYPYSYSRSIFDFVCICKIMGTFVISSFLALVFIIFSSSATMYLTGLVIIGAEYLLYTLIGQNSFLNLLKYINIFYILDGGEFFGSYLNLNIFSNAVTSIPIAFAVFGTVFLLCTVFSCILFCKRNQQKTAGIFQDCLKSLNQDFLH